MLLLRPKAHHTRDARRVIRSRSGRRTRLLTVHAVRRVRVMAALSASVIRTVHRRVAKGDLHLGPASLLVLLLLVLLLVLVLLLLLASAGRIIHAIRG